MARRKGTNTGIPGLSFSLNRALGISKTKASISRKIGIPLTKSGRQRKFGAAAGCLLPVFSFIALLLFSICSFL